MMPGTFFPNPSSSAAGHPKTRLELEELVDSLSAEVRFCRGEGKEDNGLMK